MNKSFKHFYNLSKSPEDLFEGTFNKFYNRKHFGDIDKEMIKQQQLDWFNKLRVIIENRDLECLIDAICHRNNKVSRELFEKLTGVEVRKNTSKKIREKLIEYCKEV